MAKYEKLVKEAEDDIIKDEEYFIRGEMKERLKAIKKHKKAIERLEADIKRLIETGSSTDSPLSITRDPYFRNDCGVTLSSSSICS